MPCEFPAFAPLWVAARNTAEARPARATQSALAGSELRQNEKGARERGERSRPVVIPRLEPASAASTAQSTAKLLLLHAVCAYY